MTVLTAADLALESVEMLPTRETLNAYSGGHGSLISVGDVLSGNDVLSDNDGNFSGNFSGNEYTDNSDNSVDNSDHSTNDSYNDYGHDGWGGGHHDWNDDCEW
ncbi:hypothetical protein [Quadrisphaera setariae]|nr:hypothetical protein [Quadrisphaera setariae]